MRWQDGKHSLGDEISCVAPVLEIEECADLSAVEADFEVRSQREGEDQNSKSRTGPRLRSFTVGVCLLRESRRCSWLSRLEVSSSWMKDPCQGCDTLFGSFLTISLLLTASFAHIFISLSSAGSRTGALCTCQM